MSSVANPTNTDKAGIPLHRNVLHHAGHILIPFITYSSGITSIVIQDKIHCLIDKFTAEHAVWANQITGTQNN